MIRILAAVFLALHGIVHLIGFAVPWRLTTTDGYAYGTTALWGRFELGETGIRLVALLWIPVTLGFLVAAWGVLRDRGWALRLTAAVAIASLVLTLLASPQAIVGVAIDVVILAVVGVLAYRDHLRAPGRFPAVPT